MLNQKPPSHHLIPRAEREGQLPSEMIQRETVYLGESHRALGGEGKGELRGNAGGKGAMGGEKVMLGMTWR